MHFSISFLPSPPFMPPASHTSGLSFPLTQAVQDLARIKEQASCIDDILLEDDFSPPPVEAGDQTPDVAADVEHGSGGDMTMADVVTLPSATDAEDDPMVEDPAIPASEAAELAEGLSASAPDLQTKPPSGAAMTLLTEAEEGCATSHDPHQDQSALAEAPPEPMSRRRLFVLQSCSPHVPTPTFEKAMLSANRAVMQVRPPRCRNFPCDTAFNCF